VAGAGAPHVVGLRIQPAAAVGTHGAGADGDRAVESAAAVGALYVLLPADLAPPFVVFAVGCIGAVALGLLAHAPGGVGVFEAAVTALLSGAGRADLLAALLLYRALYNLLPFMLAVGALAAIRLSRRTDPLFNSRPGSG
jgi:phosphatidylglycerol lysyltransferase